MEKLLTSLFLQAIFKDVKTTKALVDIIYNEPPKPKAVKSKVVRKAQPLKQPVVKKQMVVSKPVEVKEVETISDKKREVMDAIKFLKSKETKTKADREKIQMLEVILKSV